MRVIVIHNPERTDRLTNIDRLRARFPQLEVKDARVPKWESDRHARCLRGCTSSHLQHARGVLNGVPVLVLEDDAVLEGELPALDSIPPSAGMVLLGGEAPNAADESHPGFRLFLPPFFGTHAVLYLPRQSAYGFLLDAFETCSFASFGFETGDLCAESVLYTAGLRSGYPMYRPNKMAFTTLGDESESFGSVQKPRCDYWEVQERPSLLPRSRWDAVFEPWRGKNAALLVVPGNAGDILIRAATHQMFRHYDIKEVPADSPAVDVVFYPGGGNIGAPWNFRDARQVFVSTKAAKVVLPQSIDAPSEYMDMADVVWLRDHRSIELYPRGQYAPDLALAYQTALTFKDPSDATEYAMRVDSEAVNGPREDPEKLDPVSRARDHYEYLVMAAKHQAIHTDRLHYAIAGLIAGRKVTLYPNSYHKNRSVWEAELAALGCEWKDH